MANDILVLVESVNGKLKGSSCELLSEAKNLSGTLGGVVNAIIIGEGVSSAGEQAGEFGAEKTFVADAPEFKDYNPERYAAVLEEAFKASQPAVILGTASSMGRDLMPRVAAKLDTGMISEGIAVLCREGRIVVTRPLYAGKCLADVVIPEANPQIITCRPNVFEVAKPESGKKAALEKVGDASKIESRAKIVEVIGSKSDRPDLTEAGIIVSAGRPIKSEENFKIMNELADVMGAAVGASRAAVDAGFAPHAIQVGQTGKTVNPSLYFAFGISGAIQHLAGMRTSKVIVAINTDPEAPIFQVADYGIVGDLFEVAPALTEEIKTLVKE